MKAWLKGGIVTLILFLAFFIGKMFQTGGEFRYFVAVSPAPALLYEIILLIVGMIVMSAVIFSVGAVIGTFVGWALGENKAENQ